MWQHRKQSVHTTFVLGAVVGEDSTVHELLHAVPAHERVGIAGGQPRKVERLQRMLQQDRRCRHTRKTHPRALHGRATVPEKPRSRDGVGSDAMSSKTYVSSASVSTSTASLIPAAARAPRSRSGTAWPSLPSSATRTGSTSGKGAASAAATRGASFGGR